MNLDRVRCNGFVFLVGALVLGTAACTTLPTPKFTSYPYPKDRAFVGDVSREYQTLGMVRTKVNFPSLDPNREEAELCRNYYNKAVLDLVRRARDQGADAVIDVKSVVFLEDGRQEFYPTPECADDGQEGQILAQGIAVKWKPAPKPLKPGASDDVKMAE